MRSLTVLYDPRCRFCAQVRRWMETEPSYLPVAFVAAGSDELVRRFPELDAEATTRELTVVGDERLVYRGGKAFLMCLWALRRYRGWALRLSQPGLLPHAEKCFQWVSTNRSWLPHLRYLFVPRI